MDEDKKLADTAILRSQEIDEIIGRPPHWLVQWGITVFLAILLLVFGISYFITYPETIVTPFKLVAGNPPVAISVSDNGSLVNLTSAEGATAKKGDTLLHWHRDATNQSIGVISPVDGTVAFTGPLVAGQMVDKQQALFYIIPKSTRVYAALYVKAIDMKTLKAGEPVLLDLADYPPSQYGSINGRVSYISSMPAAGGYYIEVLLPGDLKSNTGKLIPYKEGLNGTATIITKKQKLLDKLIKKNQQ